jgi:hypothetical protein
MDGESPFLVRVKKETQFMERFVRRFLEHGFRESNSSRKSIGQGVVKVTAGAGLVMGRARF